MMGPIDTYRKEMQTHLLERDDVKLFKYHKLAVTKADAKGIEREAIREAFLDIIDLNWQKLAEFCRSTLTQIQSEIFPNKTETRRDNYRSLVKKLRENYHAKIGESLRSRMVFIRLEYLDKRQAEDIKILMIDATAETKEERFKVKQELELRMTWGRVIIFWSYWKDCRSRTIEVLNSVLDVFEGVTEPKKNLNPEETFLRGIFEQDDLDKFLLLFAHTVSKDFSCYEVLYTKLTQFMILLSSKKILDAFDVERKDMFFNISNFQECLSAKQSESCRAYEIFEDMISRGHYGIAETAKLLGRTSRPLFHLKDLLRKLSEEDNLYQAGIKSVINKIRKQAADISVMFSEGPQSFLEISSRVNNEAQQLQNAIQNWLPTRTASITTIKEIIQKLNKTTKDVAITQTVSSSVGIVGGAIVIGCLIAAPFTLGASLIPAAIAGGVISGLGAATGIGATVAELVIDNGQMKQATDCIEEDKILFGKVAEWMEKLQLSSNMLLRYIPQDELESLLSVMTDLNSSKVLVGIRIAMNVIRLLSTVGKSVAMPFTNLVFRGTLAMSKTAAYAVAGSLAGIGVALDVANLVLAGINLGKGAKSESAEKLEDVVRTLEEEKDSIGSITKSIGGFG